MTDYNKDVPFPSPFIPKALLNQVTDPFANLVRSAAGQLPELPPVAGSGTGGTDLDLDVRRASTGALISAGTTTLTIAGKAIYWVQYEGVVNGAASFHLKLASLPYSTAL